MCIAIADDIALCIVYFTLKILAMAIENAKRLIIFDKEVWLRLKSEYANKHWCISNLARLILLTNDRDKERKTVYSILLECLIAKANLD